MASPAKMTVAVSKLQAKGCKDILDKQYGDIIVEVWRYDPALIATDRYVDKLSLYLAMRNSGDERIQKELETMIDNLQW